jgi:hypothetical protein
MYTSVTHLPEHCGIDDALQDFLSCVTGCLKKITSHGDLVLDTKKTCVSNLPYMATIAFLALGWFVPQREVLSDHL